WTNAVTTSAGAAGNAAYYTGTNALAPVTATAHGLYVGEGSSAPVFTAAGAAGTILISGGSTADPGYANNAVLTGTSGNQFVIGSAANPGSVSFRNSSGNLVTLQ